MLTVLTLDESFHARLTAAVSRAIDVLVRLLDRTDADGLPSKEARVAAGQILRFVARQAPRSTDSARPPATARPSIADRQDVGAGFKARTEHATRAPAADLPPQPVKPFGSQHGRAADLRARAGAA